MNREEIERMARAIRIEYKVSRAEVLEHKTFGSEVVDHVVGNVEIDITDTTYANIAAAIRKALEDGFNLGQERMRERSAVELVEYAHDLTSSEIGEMSGDCLGDELELVLDAMVTEVLDPVTGEPIKRPDSEELKYV